MYSFWMPPLYHKATSSQEKLLKQVDLAEIFKLPPRLFNLLSRNAKMYSQAQSNLMATPALLQFLFQFLSAEHQLNQRYYMEL